MRALVGRDVAIGICLLALAGSGCTLSLLKIPAIPAHATASPGPAIPASTVLPKAQTTFIATLPEPLAVGEAVALALLDEVTGLSLNSELYPMQSIDGSTYTATLAIPYMGIVKYRYERLGAAQVPEDTALDQSIRYRLYYAAGPAEVRDVIASWTDRRSTLPMGSIQGRISNLETGVPIPNMLVTAAGQRVFSDSAGRFELQAVPAGTHNLVAYAVDGTYETFQQGATVAQGLNTAVEIKLKSSPLVRVTFIVSAPDDVQGAPVRIAGNLLELGNTFADLRGGLSTVAERMPVMALQPDGRYSATISLPVGADVRYKYTLGDGFWNAERVSSGGFRLRELIVPLQDVVVQDSVDTWNAGNSSPILFEVTVAPNTPAADLISIQFNPFGWTEPIPMWPMGGNRWAYKLYGPINDMGELHYRYCRAGQCGSADDLASAGDGAEGRTVATSLSAQNIQDTVGEWAWLKDSEPGTLVGSTIMDRPGGFVAGVELQQGFRANWPYYNPQTVQGVQALGANWLVFTPSWTFRSVSPLEFGVAPEHDPFWLDTAIMISQARSTNLSVGLFAVPHFPGTAADFWSAAPRDAAWWESWFEHYRAFTVHHGDLASQTGAQALILGGEWLSPALPGGVLADGSSSNVPADADVRWHAVLAETRRHFAGKIWWALPHAPGGAHTSPGVLSEIDGLYLLWDAPLAAEGGATKTDLANQAGQLLDQDVEPLATALEKPIMLALAYPSAEGVKTGCFNDGTGGCLDWSALTQPQNPASIAVDLRAQADMYEAVLNAINSRAFVGGMVSRGYYPPTVLQDKSASIHGKPAADLLWYWFPRLSGVLQ